MKEENLLYKKKCFINVRKSWLQIKKKSLYGRTYLTLYALLLKTCDTSLTFTLSNMKSTMGKCDKKFSPVWATWTKKPYLPLGLARC